MRQPKNIFRSKRLRFKRQLTSMYTLNLGRTFYSKTIEDLLTI